MLAALLCLALLCAPPAIDTSAETVDAMATRDALSMRLGDVADDWKISVGPLARGRAVVTMTAPDGWVLEREVPLDASDPRVRGRQLAASVAVVIENYEPRDVRPAPAWRHEPGPAPSSAVAVPTAARAPIQGWLGAGGLLVGGPPDRSELAAGVDLAGGAWLVRDRVMPWAAVGWRRSTSGELVVDGASVVAGAALGLPFAGRRLWLGGGLAVGALAGVARESQRASGWAAQISAPVVGLARLGRVFIGVHVGPEFALPPLRFRGNVDDLRWGLVRVAAGIRVGVSLGARPRVGFASARPV